MLINSWLVCLPPVGIYNPVILGHNLLLPKVRTEMAGKSFYFNGSKLFNNITSEMKDSKSVVILKCVFWNYIDQKFFSYLLSFCISLEFKCLLIAVF